MGAISAPVVCPDADVKIYVTATPEVRARRRYLELQSRGEPASYEAVLADIRRRDERDAVREVSPMRPAADAFLLDTSNLDIEAAVDTAVGAILRKVGQSGRAVTRDPQSSWHKDSPAGELTQSWARS
jgi:cytidylate kinase